MIGAVELSLISKAKLNKAKTAENVKAFFTNDFNHYLNLANKHLSDISSPTLDANGIVVHDGRNHQDESMIINMDAQAVVKAVDHAISACNYSHGIILYLYFIKKIQDDRIAERLGYQNSRYYEIKNDALVEFAERFDFWRQQDNTSIEDLRAFDNEEIVN